MTDHYVAYVESEVRELRAERDRLRRRLDAVALELRNGHHCEACLTTDLTTIIEGDAERDAEITSLRGQVQRVRELLDGPRVIYAEYGPDAELVNAVTVKDVRRVLDAPNP